MTTHTQEGAAPVKRFGRRDVAEGAPVVVPVVVAEVVPARPPAAAKIEQMTAALRVKALQQVDPTTVADMPVAALQRYLEQVIHQIANEDRHQLSGREQAALAEELAQDMLGNGPIDPLLRDDEVTDIMVNGPKAVYVERRGKLELTDVQFRDNAHIAALAQKIVARVGRRIDESSPLVDARLLDGSRVNVVFPPLAVDSPCISIRKFSRRRLGLN